MGRNSVCQQPLTASGISAARSARRALCGLLSIAHSLPERLALPRPTGSSGFAFSPRASAAGITGVIPENAIDATDCFVNNQPHRDFLSQQFMSTSNRHMQFGVHLIF